MFSSMFRKSDKEPLVSDTAKQEPRTSTTVKKLGLFTIIGISIVLTQVYQNNVTNYYKMINFCHYVLGSM